MASTEGKTKHEGATRASGDDSTRSSRAGQRRGSFSEGSDDGKTHAASDLKKTISKEVERRQEGEVAETILEAAVESASGTPSVGTPQATAAGTATQAAADSLAKAEDQEPVNPDKPTTAAEEEPAAMKPAEPSSEEAVSGGQALPPGAEDLRKTDPAAPGDAAADVPETKATEESAKTPPTKATEKATKAFKSVKAAVKPNAIAAKPEPKSESHPKAPTKKPSRSSLTPSVAAHAKSVNGDKAAPAKSPTHSSDRRFTGETRAHAPQRHPEQTKWHGCRCCQAETGLIKATPRTSLAASQRPSSRTSTNGGQKPAVASDSFLERMMRPTAASASKVHEKPAEIKSPSRASKALPMRPKTNGHVKKPAEKTSSPSTTAQAEQAPAAGTDESFAADTTEVEKQEPTSAGDKGDATPLSQEHGDTAAVPGLEATPAFGDKEIR
ncbi:hypothetical protein Tdes44962_MAKER08194 [Teratosphaeria destructans]|uniref:Uncharacterized protein n=1 Tax=Teratosphaeria destructans TaxID=418781 RepID=A0A9W7W4X7_9PEZI|nr:hypothetical protein Tdes44962_MAKER08194 [Teratosphaeria destructans]